MIQWFYFCIFVVAKQSLALDLDNFCPKPLYTGSIELLTTNALILFNTSDDIFSGDFFDGEIFYGNSKYRINISIDYNHGDYYLYQYYLAGLYNFKSDYMSRYLTIGYDYLVGESSLIMNLTAYYNYDNAIVSVRRNIEVTGLIYNNNTHSWSVVGLVNFTANCDLQNVINIYNNNYTQINLISIYIDVINHVAFNHTGISNLGELVWQCRKINSTTSTGNNIHDQSMTPTFLPVMSPTVIAPSIQTTINNIVSSDNNKNSSLFENDTFIIVVMVTIGIIIVVLLVFVLLCFIRKGKVNQSEEKESQFKNIHRMPSKSVGAPENTDGNHDVTIVYANGATAIGVTNESIDNNNYADSDINTGKNNKEDCLAYGNTKNIKKSGIAKQTRRDNYSGNNNPNKELAFTTEGLQPMHFTAPVGTNDRMNSIISDNEEDRNKLNEIYMQRLQPEGVVNDTQNEGSTK